MLLFRFQENATPDVIRDVLAELSTFPEKYPQMRNWALGENVSTRDSSMTHGMVVEFRDERALLDYLHSESHERFVRERWRPVIDRQVIVTIGEPEDD